MDRIRISDVIRLIDISAPPAGKSSYYTECPICDRQGRKKDKHLNINLMKNVFRCARCGWNGGMFDLFAYYSGISRDKARSEIMRILKMDLPSREKTARMQENSQSDNAGQQVADTEVRHAAYSTLLSLLSLAPDHYNNLLERGLSEKAIIEGEYKTAPIIGSHAIAKSLLESVARIEGVPGFYKDNEGIWSFIKHKRGILIPVRDMHGRIQGLQNRLDNLNKRKYRWVSSADVDNSTCGIGAEGWIHIKGVAREKVILTEGPLKADIVHHLTGQTVIGVPGVNSLKHLEIVLLMLMEQGVKQVMTAFDMDFLKNPHVQNGYNGLLRMLEKLNLTFGTYLWHPGYNGLDDYIWGCCIKRNNQMQSY
jgi:hypothetical protein